MTHVINPSTTLMSGPADPLICEEQKLIRAITMRQQREVISIQPVSLVSVKAALSRCRGKPQE